MSSGTTQDKKKENTSDKNVAVGRVVMNAVRKLQGTSGISLPNLKKFLKENKKLDGAEVTEEVKLTLKNALKKGMLVMEDKNYKVKETKRKSSPSPARGRKRSQKRAATPKKQPRKRSAPPKNRSRKKVTSSKKVLPAKKVAPSKKVASSKKIGTPKKVAPSKKVTSSKKIATPKKAPAKMRSRTRKPAGKD